MTQIGKNIKITRKEEVIDGVMYISGKRKRKSKLKKFIDKHLY